MEEGDQSLAPQRDGQLGLGWRNHMTRRRLLSFLMGVYPMARISMAQGPKKDVGKNVPLPPGSDQKAPAKSSADQPPQVPALSIDVDLMSFDVVVTDQSGNPISGLEKQHFRVFDDDVEQNVTNFSPAEAPLGESPWPGGSSAR